MNNKRKDNITRGLFTEGIQIKSEYDNDGGDDSYDKIKHLIIPLVERFHTAFMRGTEFGEFLCKVKTDHWNSTQ